MHSSDLRGSDFTITLNGEFLSHAEFFAAHTARTRVGILAPSGTEGVDAITFLMGAVTAFYDRYREESEDFFAYPDFYSFQRGTVLTDFCYLDFWPKKDVRVLADHNQTLAAITDRGVNVLLVPDTAPRKLEYEPARRQGARRNLERCFVYGAGDLSISCATEPLRTYAERMLDGTGTDVPAWTDGVTQSFREVAIDEALSRL